jgi:CxxC motif-containing protein
MKKFTCIVCPISCSLTVQAEGGGDITVTGSKCDRGKAYAKDEYLAPKRVITTTVKIDGADIALLPVIGTAPVPKELLRTCLRHLYGIRVTAPVRMGDVVERDILGSGVDIVAARSVVIEKG